VYDVLHRLTDETGPYGQRVYSYDANGNRQTRDKIDQLYDQNNLPTISVTRNQSYSYPLDSQQLTQINTVKNGNITNRDLSYDAAGNTKTKHTKNFAYDARNRVKTYSKNGVLVAEYRYNAQGERIEKIKHKSDGTIRSLHFHYDLNGQLLGLSRYNNSGLLKAHKDIIWLDNMPVAQVTTRYKNDGTEKSRQLVYLHTDHLNTPRIATDASQTVAWHWDSDAFGQGKPDTDPDNNGKKTFVPLRFPGQIASEGGLYYNYYRYYDPQTGRYITSDPIGLEGGINTYLYVNANPLKYTDPTGRCPWCVGVAVGGAIGGVGNAIGAHFNGGSVSDVGAAFVTGASTGVLFGATGGAAGSVTTFIVTGATAGALTSGLTSLATGNNLSQARDAALGGAAIGILTGVFGHSTALANALANLRNSLSSAASIARGDLTGALAAALSGLGLGAFENVVKNSDSCKE
jgi:RHS repeat-associated protein